jgi:hypothetical protein
MGDRVACGVITDDTKVREHLQTGQTTREGWSENKFAMHVFWFICFLM